MAPGGLRVPQVPQGARCQDAARKAALRAAGAVTSPEPAEAVRASDRAHGPGAFSDWFDRMFPDPEAWAERFRAQPVTGHPRVVPMGEPLTPLTIPAIAELLSQLPKPKLRELHCHPRVTRHLRTTSAEAEPGFPGAIGTLTGIPVIEHDDMKPGAWELREDGDVVASGRLRTMEEWAREVTGQINASGLLPEGYRFEREGTMEP